MAARPGAQTLHRPARDREDPGKDRVHAEERESVAELKSDVFDVEVNVFVERKYQNDFI